MLDKFFAFSGKGDLDAQEPLIEDNLKKWEKASATVTKAKQFEDEDLGG